ncbi:MAG: GntR family transcriptional regulator [Verrucomicrobiae bacterium]|nr:GntR family transcriptional regulator [Verrucomicrobiae bacterium]
MSAQIERFLKNRILNGELAPATRLPPTSELARQWHVDSTAVCLAMTRLTQEGLIDRIPRRGTFVRLPTDKVMIGILVGSNLTAEVSHYPRALVEYLRVELAQRKDCRWTGRIYDSMYETSLYPQYQELPVYQNLTRDLKNYCFKGTIQLHGSLHDFDITSWDIQLPTVRLATVVTEARADVTLDFFSFGQESVRYLASRQRRKIVYLRTLDTAVDGDMDLEGIQATAQRMGLPGVETHFLEHVSHAQFEEIAHQKTRRLIDQWAAQKSWPDALIISDDLAARGAAFALHEKSVRIPDKMLVVVMANQGINHYYGFPVIRCEFPIKTVAQSLIDILWKKMVGKAVPNHPVKIPVLSMDSKEEP